MVASDSMRISRPSGGASLTLAEARFEVLLPIASGGMGTVYLARRRCDGLEVALKIPHAFLRDISEFRREMEEEAGLTAQIRHPHVVALVEAGKAEDGLYLAMEYVEGETLAMLGGIAGPLQSLPLGIGVRMLLDALAGLHAAHELKDPEGRAANVVHCDVCPQNLLVGLDGRTRVIDFGVARSNAHATGAIRGRSAYMAPEQAEGRAVDRRCDVWAAGVVGWELVAGRRLHEGDGRGRTLGEELGEPPPLQRVRPDVPRGLARALEAALRVDVAVRCANAATLAGLILEGCHEDGLAVAAHAEVAAHVGALVGERIARRRAEVAGLVPP